MDSKGEGSKEWMSKAYEAWRLWSDASMQISRHLTDFSVNAAKESMSLYAEVYTTNVEALQAGQTYVMQQLQHLPETMQHWQEREPQRVQEFLDNANNIGRLAQNNAHAVLRSSEQYWLTAQQTGSSVQETYTQLYQKLATLYTTS